MKYIYIIAAFVLMSAASFGQIGINTENVVSGAIFQVDPLGNNTTGTGAQLADDMIISLNNATGVVGLGKKASTAAQLDLGSHKKALKMNEVKLQSLTDIVTVPNPRAGMIVYNTVAIASEEVEIGWYYFDGVKWNRILKAERDPALKNEFSIPYLLPDQIEIPSMSYSDATSGIYSGTLKMPFVNSETNQIKAPADGTYVFALRFYFYSTILGIPLPEETYDSQAVLYAFLVSKTQNKVLEKALISFPFTQRFRRYYSYRLVMGTSLNKDEEIEIYIGRGQSPDFQDCPLSVRVLDSSDPSLKSAARTSMVFWKL